MRWSYVKALSVLAGGLMLQLAGGEPALARPDQPAVTLEEMEQGIKRGALEGSR